MLIKGPNFSQIYAFHKNWFNLYLVIELASYELTFVAFSDHVPYFRKQRHALLQILISWFKQYLFQNFHNTHKYNKRIIQGSEKSKTAYLNSFP